MLYTAIDSRRICLASGRHFVKGVVRGVTIWRSNLQLFRRSLILIRCTSLARLFFLFHGRVPDKAAIDRIFSGQSRVGQA
jgi:hypothetical protein